MKRPRWVLRGLVPVMGALLAGLLLSPSPGIAGTAAGSGGSRALVTRSHIWSDGPDEYCQDQGSEGIVCQGDDGPAMQFDSLNSPRGSVLQITVSFAYRLKSAGSTQ